VRQVRLGRSSALTRVVAESLEPDWNETFTFSEAEVGAAVAVGGRLVFEVWDRDYATLDDFMGQARCAGSTPALQIDLSATAQPNKQCMHVNNQLQHWDLVRPDE